MPPQDVEVLVRWGYAWSNRERKPPATWLPDEEGRTRRLEEFFDRGEALEAVGLEE
jgi:hypothetical protein